MMERHDVVIVGGGIMGATALFEFARRGVDALLLEEEPVFGGKDSSKTAGIVRTQYSNAEVVRIAIRGRELFRDFPRLTGRAPVFNEIGHVFLAPHDLLELTRQNVAMQRAEGTIVDELPASDLPRFAPGMIWEGIGAVFHEPASGYVEPVPAAVGFIAAAEGLGAAARPGVHVERLRMDHGTVAGLDTTSGPIFSKDVVVAAGVGSKALAATAGLDLPIDYSIEQELVVIARHDEAPRVSISNAVDACYLRPELAYEASAGERAVLLGRGFPKPYPRGDPSHYPDQVAVPDLTADLLGHISLRNPQIAAAPVVEAKVALYDITPDWHPLLGRPQAIPGLILITGGSGHGFKLAPAFAEMVAAEYVGEPVTYASLQHFSPDRFTRGETFGSIYGGNRA